MVLEFHAANLDLKNRFTAYKLVLGLAITVVEALIAYVCTPRAYTRHLVRRGLYCEIQPVFHRPGCRVLFTRITGEVAMQFLYNLKTLGICSFDITQCPITRMPTEQAQ